MGEGVVPTIRSEPAVGIPTFWFVTVLLSGVLCGNPGAPDYGRGYFSVAQQQKMIDTVPVKLCGLVLSGDGRCDSPS